MKKGTKKTNNYIFNQQINLLKLRKMQQCYKNVCQIHFKSSSFQEGMQ